MRLQSHGVNAVEPGAAVTKPAPRDGVFPDDFYSTTNLETVVRLGGSWVPVEHPEMDCGLLVSGSRVRTVPVSDVREGDMVVCGASGVRVVLPPREHSAHSGARHRRRDVRLHVLGGVVREAAGAAGAPDRVAHP